MELSSDWRNYCSPIQDQGECGSCTAFGSIGAWEPNIRILEGNPTDPLKLSERDLFFCSGGTCENGNTPKAVLDWAQSNGTCSEACLPYGDVSNGTDYPCGARICASPVYTKIVSWTPITSVTQMKALLAKGPLVTTMICHQSFMNYVSGVYHNLGASDPIVGGHMIAIVGYDDTKGAWLLRNSWGTEWGMAGYCWIKYGDSNIDNTMYQIVPTTPAPPISVPFSVTASDSEDRITRVWAVFVDTKPGNYKGSGTWAAGKPAFRAVSRQGKTKSTTLSLTSGQHTIYFIVSQSGGPKYGSYSGTATINGTSFPFSGVTCGSSAYFSITV